ncbi:MAG TPA: hypothetical protein VF125_04255 [Solirubrobacterales bacterium]
MALVEIARELWQRKLQVGIVVALALAAAIFSAYRFTAHGLEKRSLTVAAASSQILVDSPKSTLVAGAEVGEFAALATRAKIYGQYLSSLAAREEIAKRVGVPAQSISTSGPFSPATGQQEYASQPSEERAGELLQEGAGNRLVFTAQEGVPILTVSAQAATTDRAVALAAASFQTLKEYVDNLSADGEPVRRGVTVRQLGAPEGGTLGGSNNVILMALAFLLVFGLGCAAILVLPTFVARWRALNKLDRPKPPAASIKPVQDPDPFDPRLDGEDPDEPVTPHATTRLG